MISKLTSKLNKGYTPSPTNANLVRSTAYYMNTSLSS